MLMNDTLEVSMVNNKCNQMKNDVTTELAYGIYLFVLFRSMFSTRYKAHWFGWSHCLFLSGTSRPLHGVLRSESCISSYILYVVAF